MLRKIDLSKFTDEELEEIGKRINCYMWDERLGKKPFLFDKMERYKKANNMKYRLETLFRAVCPVTRYDFIKPVLIGLAKRNIKGFESWKKYTYLKMPLKRLRRWQKAFSNQHPQA